ncbi:MAG: hypothetical protein JRJ44_03800 [Deltaproteobacteria bacterium]|nr:hypothetical protein [Deltaproteobacteria bacterium]
MPFDASKDKIIKKWECKETGLIISINKYAGGEAKVQIGPRAAKKKNSDQISFLKAGRLTVEDILWLYDIIDGIKEEITAQTSIE